MVLRETPTRGILLDLDFAIQVRDGDKDVSPEPSFAAISFHGSPICCGFPPKRLYRHDLESFFYMPGWILCRCDAHGEPKALHQFTAWHNGPLDDIIPAKRRFTGVPSHITSDRSSPSLQSWLRRLCRMFGGGYREVNCQDAHVDQETRGGI
ncbi:uncharacterized protein EI90DRAFT_2138465 [Cantharellus anzutake]|uniref:uncharacterized protein n=1 Tax=Cantharellus anzutake TaxID=1750568 RepID=UPI001903D312|nr:uncharacterized protein EI90DRAFT_2138465 [Cantharellus anzutake]KAF8325408.1 hypothetical protein EI90DRAFT_2138465 [Cantharellus anzutake]